MPLQTTMATIVNSGDRKPNFSFCYIYYACMSINYTENFKSCIIDLVTVFDAILTSRQTREKLQCLYENLMSNNFRKQLF